MSVFRAVFNLQVSQYLERKSADVQRRELSPRERQIAKQYAGGATYQVIATRLCIAPSTVRTHLATIYRKLGVSSKLELLDRLDGNRATPRNQTDLEAISREKALSEVLRIIGGSRGDIDAVMPSILRYALELCDAEFGILFEYRDDSTFCASFTLGIPDAFQQWLNDQGAFPANPDTGLGRVQVTREVVNIIDVHAEGIYRSDDSLRYATASLGGARSFVAIPMMAAGNLVGAFTIYRQQVRPFNATATRLAQMFADQSVIALQYVRLLSALRRLNSRA